MKKIKFILKIIIAIGGLGGLLGYMILIPKISLSPSVILDPNNPFSTPFILKNDGAFAIKEIETETVLKNVTDSRNNQFINNTLASSVNNQLKLNSNKETSLSIELEPMIVGLGFPLNNAEVSIVINYKYFFFNSEDTFEFIMKKNSSGDAIWYPNNK